MNEKRLPCKSGLTPATCLDWSEKDWHVAGENISISIVSVNQYVKSTAESLMRNGGLLLLQVHIQ
jgi:hypothetical protein